MHTSFLCSFVCSPPPNLALPAGWHSVVWVARGFVEAKLGGAGEGEAGEAQDKKNSQYEHRVEVSGVLCY